MAVELERVMKANIQLEPRDLGDRKSEPWAYIVLEDPPTCGLKFEFGFERIEKMVVEFEESAVEPGMSMLRIVLFGENNRELDISFWLDAADKLLEVFRDFTNESKP